MLEKSEKFIEEFIGELKNTGLRGDLSLSRYYRLISECQKIIHAQIPDEKCSTDRVAAAEMGQREEVFEGINYKRAVIYLMSNGCEWALKSAHGCTMCGHLAKQARRDEPISVEDYLKQVEGEFKRIDFKEYPILNLYNNGSFINDNEIPPEARREILKMVNNNPHIKMLVLETRPEFVTEERVSEIRDLIPNKHVELAVGFETKSDFYRAICINKGFFLKRFNYAAEIIKKYVKLRTYVLLKPLFLTEKEAIEDAIETIEYAFAIGATTVSLEACTIQDYTLMKYLYEKGVYNTPWLWSIIEVVKRVKNPSKLIVGLFKFFPSPSKVPNNCYRCNEKVMEAIVKYNRTLNPNVFDGITCECKREWKKVLKENPIPFEERLKIIPGILDELKGSYKNGERAKNPFFAKD
ncbi:MAG: archaeosine biosynthesis radical SAM protein RaSEA [Candidatus Freyarchaeota archaeon]